MCGKGGGIDQKRERLSVSKERMGGIGERGENITGQVGWSLEI